jgi:hypothetical protein
MKVFDKMTQRSCGTKKERMFCWESDVLWDGGVGVCENA